MYKLLQRFTVTSDVYRSFISNKTTKYCLPQWISKLPKELWNPSSKTVPGKFHSSDEHSKHNCLQDLANFHRSRAWQIVLIFNTEFTLRWKIMYWYISPSRSSDEFKWLFIKMMCRDSSQNNGRGGDMPKQLKYIWLLALFRENDKIS